MTSEEKQEIISAVLAALHTNSKTIAQLTPVTALNDNDSFEVSGGKRISFARLMGIVSAAVDLSEVEAGIAANVLNSLSVTEGQEGITLTVKQKRRNAVDVTIPYVDDETGGFISADQYAALPKWDEVFSSLVKRTPELGNTYAPDANIVILERIDGEVTGIQQTGTAWYNGTQLKVVNFEGEVVQMAVDKNRLYYDKTTKLLYRCNENYRLVPMAGTAASTDYDPTESGIDATNVQAAIDELAARPTGGGSVTKDNIDALRDWCLSLYNSLGNIAFWDAGNKPGIPPVMDWPTTPQVTVTISTELEHATIKRNGSVVGTSVTIDKGSNLVLTVEAGAGYTLDDVTADHGTVTESGGVYTVAWNGIQSDSTLTIGGTEELIPIITHSVTYNLTGCNKTSGDTTVVDGEGLTAVFAKGNDFPSDTGISYNKRDFLVLIGGDYAVEGTDYSKSQTGDNVTINIPSVEDDVEILNIVWSVGYLNASDTITTGSGRGRCSVPYIPIPDGCVSLHINDNWANTGAWGHNFYDGAGAMKSHTASTIGVTSITWDADEQGDHKYIRVSVYAWPEPAEKSLNTLYIKDMTNNVYIWKGDNITE